MKDMRTTTRYIPENALPVAEEGLGVVYVYPIPSRNGKPPKFGAIAYHEKAYKAAGHYSYRSDAELDVAIAAPRANTSPCATAADRSTPEARCMNLGTPETRRACPDCGTNGEHDCPADVDTHDTDPSVWPPDPSTIRKERIENPRPMLGESAAEAE